MIRSNLILAGLFVVVFGVSEITAQCNYEQPVYPGNTYQVFSPGYANNYVAGLSCSWLAVAPPGYKIVLSCPVVNIPCTDSFVVNQYGQMSGTGDNPMCGSGTTTINSLTNAISVRLQTRTNTGRFYCTMTVAMDSCQCGRRQTGRIVGGTAAGVNEFPYQTLLTDNYNYPVCGGALISEYYVLTAAHCVASRTTASTRIVVGEHDRTTTTDTSFTATYNVQSFTVHSGYNSKTGVNDIALVRSSSVISLNQGVGIICLPFAIRGNLFAGNSVTVAGWGTTEYGGPLSSYLRKTDVGVIANSVCDDTFAVAASNDFICTYGNGKDTCQHDSGTNLFLQSAGRVYTVGVTSGGHGCGGSTPALNMRVTQYLDWIQQNTPGATYCSI